MNVNQTTYDIQENWLKLAAKYFNINLDILKTNDTDIENSNISLLKAGLFGYVNEIIANEVKNSVAHRNVLYDEFFINTASFPESIYKFAKTYNVPISLATPAHMLVTLAVRKNDLVNSPIREEVVEDQYIDLNTMKTYKVTIDRHYTFSIDKFEFSLPYDVIITMKQTKNGDYTITAQYAIDGDLFQFTDTLTSQIKVYQDITDGEPYVYLALDIYQMASISSPFTILTNSVSENLFYTTQFTNQLAGFNVFYTYNGKREVLKTYFNNTFTPMDPNEKFCYFNYLDDDKLQISFSSMAGSFRPEYNSQIEVEVLTTSGEEGNFQYDGEIKFNFSSSTSNFSTMLMKVVPITSSSGGYNKLDAIDEKQKIINQITTRDSIIMDSDLNNFFNELNVSNTYNNSKLEFMRRRDDILNRVYSAFLLLRDDTGKVLPTTTAPSLKIPLNYFSSHNSGNSIDGYILPEHSVFKYNYLTEKYELVEEGYTNEIKSMIQTDKDSLIYVNPFLIKIDVDPTINATYYKLDINDTFSMDFSYSNALINTSLLINNLEINKSVNYESDLNADTYVLKVNLNSNETINEVDSKVKIRGVLMSESTGQKYGYFDFSRELTATESTTDSDSTYIARISTNRKFSNGLLSIADSLYNADGETIDNVFIEEDVVIKIGVLYHDPDKEYRTNESVNVEGGIFSDAFPTDMQSTTDIDDYVLATSVATNETVRLYRNLSTIMNSTVFRTTTNQSTPYDQRDFQVEMIPLVGLDYFINENKYLYTIIDRYIDILQSVVPKLENSTNIDLKFYNTRGPSKYFYLDTSISGDDIEYLSIGRTDILLDFTFGLYETANDDLDASIKDFISDFLEASNDEGIVRISNLFRLLETEFSAISYIEFNGLAGRYNDSISNKYQKILRKDIDLKTMTKQEVIEYIPEYINIKKQLTNQVVTVEDADSSIIEVNLGKQYNNIINVTYTK